MARTSDRRSVTNTANHILILIWLLEQVSTPLYRFLYSLEHRRRWNGCTNKSASICVSYMQECRRSGTGTATYILIRLSKQVPIPFYRFLHFLEHHRRWCGCTKKNCFNSRLFQRFCNLFDRDSTFLLVVLNARGFDPALRLSAGALHA